MATEQSSGKKALTEREKEGGSGATEDWSRRPLSQSETWSMGTWIKQGGVEDELREEKKSKFSFLLDQG